MLPQCVIFEHMYKNALQLHPWQKPCISIAFRLQRLLTALNCCNVATKWRRKKDEDGVGDVHVIMCIWICGLVQLDDDSHLLLWHNFAFNRLCSTQWMIKRSKTYSWCCDLPGKWLLFHQHCAQSGCWKITGEPVYVLIFCMQLRDYYFPAIVLCVCTARAMHRKHFRWNKWKKWIRHFHKVFSNESETMQTCTNSREKNEIPESASSEGRIGENLTFYD